MRVAHEQQSGGFSMVVHVTVASPDGTYKHPYQPDTIVAAVRHDAFIEIHPANISESETFLLFANSRITDERRTVSEFAHEDKHSREASFTLAWHNPAGSAR
jgi:hypothetical protein